MTLCRPEKVETFFRTRQGKEQNKPISLQATFHQNPKESQLPVFLQNEGPDSQDSI